MSEEIKDAVEEVDLAEEPTVEEAPGKALDFRYGDMHVTCNHGHKTLVAENIEQGLQIFIVNREDSYLTLSCPECKIELKMQLEPAKSPPEDKIPEDDIAEATIEEMKEVVAEEIETKELDDELQENITEE